ncbi:uncharacterized protein LOC114189007 [Vigna unguiculata]|uniref:uncharacterized protein LOC114189007 n=1 Tax=Vigna unguiculata TaxID=3917 RepID=UPI0010168AC5|nr:uncharacterized protein LOC114189007 [Vigna unguiculata]
MSSYPNTSLSPQQEDEIQFSDDKNFALHGKILLLVFLSVFFLLFIFVLMIPWLRKRRGSHDSGTEEDSNIESQNNNPSTPSHNCFRRRRKEDVTLFTQET